MGKLKLHHWIIIAMVLGAGVGLPLNIAAENGAVETELVQQVAHFGEAIGGLFLSLLKMVVVPLIISSLITGVTGLGDPRKLGKIGARTFGYYLLTSALAITVGIAVTNLVNPGAGVDLESLGGQPTEVSDTVAGAETSLGSVLWNQLTGMIPTNPVHASAEGDMLPVIFFSLLFGLFISLTGGVHADRLRGFFESFFEVMMKMTMFIISLAPFGVFGFMLFAAAGSGLDAFAALGWYMLAVALGLAFHALVTLPTLLFLITRRSPYEFAKAMSPALLTAFSTASSNGTLPLTMQNIEERAGVPNEVSSFVLPLGATVNMDGTALYEVAAVLFIAQVYGLDLTLAQQIIVAVTALLASVGAAGIPHAGTVMMVVVLGAVGLPGEAVGLILAVDRVLDMGRTAVNVWSDSTAAAVVAHFEESPAPSEPAAA